MKICLIIIFNFIFYTFQKIIEDYSIYAQGLVRGTKSNLKKETFHEFSFIYKKSNEQLEYVTQYFKNKDKILCVIGSGDQILNSMLFKPSLIVGFDISVYPHLFLKLKMAAIQSLSRDEFINFFFGTIYTYEEDLYDDIYFNKICPFLDDEAKNFWTYLFEYNDWYDIYNSILFSSETVIPRRALEQNAYLNFNNYYKLREIIPKINIEFIVSDIFDLEIKNNFDLIYLSNIIQYVNVYEYKKKIKSLTDNGKTEVLTYLFQEINDALIFFNDTNTTGINFNKNGLLIHKKKEN